MPGLPLLPLLLLRVTVQVPTHPNRRDLTPRGDAARVCFEKSEVHAGSAQCLHNCNDCIDDVLMVYDCALPQGIDIPIRMHTANRGAVNGIWFVEGGTRSLSCESVEQAFRAEFNTDGTLE